VKVDGELGTIVWPNEADLDPDVLYARATGTYDELMRRGNAMRAGRISPL
jgi:cytosine/adenosine deaminase-related metal-dependent hydrolase